MRKSCPQWMMEPWDTVAWTKSYESRKTTVRAFKQLLFAVTVLCAADAWSQRGMLEPHVGYLYPAGGQQGAVVNITAGGQHLKRVQDVYVSGEGVQARVSRYVGRFVLKGEEGRALRQRFEVLWKQRRAELSGESVARDDPSEANAEDMMLPSEMEPSMVALPDHPLLENLEQKSLRELAYLRHEFVNYRKRQPNIQIAETVLIEVAIDPDAVPGDREIRLRTPRGVTNPIRFQVGVLPEVRETELNDPKPGVALPDEPPIEPPVLLNGQIMPGDVDRFSIRAAHGQQLVIEAQARKLMPYLADAVPGWFQATVALYDPRGKEVAFGDDYRFSPDPVLFYEIPEDGVYELEIRDAIYRGREDFVYRIALGELPFITEAFPLGGRAGTPTLASIAGWNLPTARLRLDTQEAESSIRQAVLRRDGGLSNDVWYAVDGLPEMIEAEPNNTPRFAQWVKLPRLVNGRIGEPGDVDVFQFEGGAGDEVVAEVMGRKLHSPLDSLLRLTDVSGQVLEWNDDYVRKDGYVHMGPGLLTHHADSYLRARLPSDGSYFVHLADSQHHGGHAYAYRLRLSAPRRDFALRATPSTVNVFAGRAAPICVYVSRQDGFDAAIDLVLKDAPEGFALSGAKIPEGRDHVRMTLTAPSRPFDEPVVLRLEGRALIDGRVIKRPVIPSEDLMQAFLYRHLVPSQELVVAVGGPRYRGRPIELAVDDPVRIPVGGATRVWVRTPKHPNLAAVRLELSEAPEGVTLGDVRVLREGLAFLLEADEAQAGLEDNLIVEAFLEREIVGKGNDAAKRTRRIPVGVLPAIPFEVVQ
jgi:hypothetical protein